jgi:DNA polymerase V
LLLELVQVRELRLIQEAITTHAVRCAEKLRSEKGCAKYVSVILKTNPFDTIGEYYNGYKSLSLNIPTNDTVEIIRTANTLLKSMYRKGLTYKKAGVIVGDIIPQDEVQLHLFDIDANYIKKKNLYGTVDKINQKMGRDKVQILGQGIAKRWVLKRERLSPSYTTRWDELLKVHC